jgi:hypothetical protein
MKPKLEIDNQKEFGQCWRAFCDTARTLKTDVRDHKDWRKGRERYYLWSLDFDNEQLAQRLDSVQGVLKPFLIQPYKRQIHLTLFVCGFLTDQVVHNDDIEVKLIDSQIDDVKNHPPSSIMLDVAGINSFLAAPYLEVYPRDQSLNELRCRLAKFTSEVRFENWLPHITVGLYNDNLEIDNVRPSLLRLRSLNPITVKINSISLLSYYAADVAGKLRTECQIFLA